VFIDETIDGGVKIKTHRKTPRLSQNSEEALDGIEP
jgi:hypothetical protein